VRERNCPPSLRGRLLALMASHHLRQSESVGKSEIATTKNSSRIYLGLQAILIQQGMFFEINRCFVRVLISWFGGRMTVGG
jgi:hypothetical protein